MSIQSSQTVPAHSHIHINKMMKALLRSPLHWVMSKNVMLITFTGRKSGQQFTTPVTYLREGRQITVFTTNQWWKNLIGGAPVSLVIKGKTVQGIGTPNEDQNIITTKMEQFLREKGPQKAWMIELNNLPKDQMPTREEIANAARAYVLVQIQLEADPR